MSNFPASELRPDGEQSDRHPAAPAAAPADAMASRTVARARWLMIISGLTTMIAIAAVIGAIGYRVFRAGGSGAAAPAAGIVTGIVTLPKGARVIATAVADERIVVTLDIAGATEIRTFDAKTLRQTGRIRFATEP